MAVQARRDQSTEPLILSDSSDVENGDIVQDAQRAADLLFGTVMAQVAATELWTPWVAVNGVDGSAYPRGIYLGDTIPAADLVAGNVRGVPILVGNARVNENAVVFDQDTLNAASVIGAATIHAVTGRKAILQTANIRLQDTVAISDHEN
jgi:hypothetical protein